MSENQHKHLLASAALIRNLAAGNSDFLAVASFLERLAKVYQVKGNLLAKRERVLQ